MTAGRAESQLTDVIKWSAPLCLALVILTIWLLAKGSKGVDISNVLNVPVGIAGIAVTVLIYQRQKAADKGGRGTSAGAHARATSSGWKLAALAAALIVGIGAPVLYWQVIHKPDLPVTDLVGLAGGRAMADGSEATLRIPGTPPSRRNLSITLDLANLAGLGDCIQAARLKLVPVLDGSAGKSSVARPGSETRLGLNGVTHSAVIDVILSEPDPACRVNLILSDAVLFN